MHFVQKETAFSFSTIMHLVVDVLWSPGPSNTFIQTWHTMQHKIKICLTSICLVVFILNQLVLFSDTWSVKSGRKNKWTHQISRKPNLCKLPDFVVLKQDLLKKQVPFLTSQLAYQWTQRDCWQVCWGRRMAEHFQENLAKEMRLHLSTWWRT